MYINFPKSLIFCIYSESPRSTVEPGINNSLNIEKLLLLDVCPLPGDGSSKGLKNTPDFFLKKAFSQKQHNLYIQLLHANNEDFIHRLSAKFHRHVFMTTD